jgi:hypothetical protein
MHNFSRMGKIGLGVALAGGLLFLLGTGDTVTQDTETASGRIRASFDAQILNNARQLLDPRPARLSRIRSQGGLLAEWEITARARH